MFAATVQIIRNGLTCSARYVLFFEYLSFILLFIWRKSTQCSLNLHLSYNSHESCLAAAHTRLPKYPKCLRWWMCAVWTTEKNHIIIKFSIFSWISVQMHTKVHFFYRQRQALCSQKFSLKALREGYLKGVRAPVHDNRSHVAPVEMHLKNVNSLLNFN